jgi:hypothetical protein
VLSVRGLPQVPSVQVLLLSVPLQVLLPLRELLLLLSPQPLHRIHFHLL